MRTCATARKSAESRTKKPATPTNVATRQTTERTRSRTAAAPRADPTVSTARAQKATTLPVSSTLGPPSGQRLVVDAANVADQLRPSRLSGGAGVAHDPGQPTIIATVSLALMIAKIGST